MIGLWNQFQLFMLLESEDAMLAIRPVGVRKGNSHQFLVKDPVVITGKLLLELGFVGSCILWRPQLDSSLALCLTFIVVRQLLMSLMYFLGGLRQAANL